MEVILIFDIIILFLLLSTYSLIFVLAFNFFTATTINRFAYRKITIIAFLNILHISMALIQEFTGDMMFMYARWLAFAIIDIYYLDVMIGPFKDRKIGKINIGGRQLEIFVRAFYVFNLVGEWALESPFFYTANGLILIALASKFKYKPVRRCFMATFALYIPAMTIHKFDLSFLPDTVTGLSNGVSFVAGTLFSLALAFSILRMYKLERIEDAVLRKREVKIYDRKN